ncbi:multidrug ABC transporter permease [Thermogymnomonas acidicola]|uniref:Multidrug ABC transporter permease n=1 Tax=Thermogymnomonas acidicola TaxID=399579 RepID=A0AA37F9U0_9ARCH|nr:ABC transporter permease [Thermogymnomonas acidicola]GGM77464.1 multidrug ABC transporter permease [Thermogymnomonas acidicola]
MERHIVPQINASILVNAVYAMVNYPVVLVNTLLAPLSMLAVVTFATHGGLIRVASEGALIMLMVSSGTSLQGDLSHLKNDMRLQDMVVSSPTSALTYVFGMAVSEIVYSVPSILVLALISSFFLHLGPLQLLFFILDLALVFTFSITLGFMLSTFSSDIVQSWAFSRLISPILSTLPPVYYPITYIPFPFRYLAFISPTTYAAAIAQNLAGLRQSPLPIWADWTVLVAVTAVMLFIGAKKSKWRE